MASLSALFVDRVGRRLLLMFSAVWMAIPLILLGGYLHWQSSFGDDWNWLPVAFLLIFVIAFSSGFGPIPWVVAGEIIPHSAGTDYNKSSKRGKNS